MSFGSNRKKKRKAFNSFVCHTNQDSLLRDNRLWVKSVGCDSHEKSKRDVNKPRGKMKSDDKSKDNDDDVFRGSCDCKLNFLIIFCVAYITPSIKVNSFPLLLHFLDLSCFFFSKIKCRHFQVTKGMLTRDQPLFGFLPLSLRCQVNVAVGADRR